MSVRDRLLFSANDYRNLSESQVMDAIKSIMQDPELATLYSLFILSSAQNNLSQASFRLLNMKRPQVTKIENLSTVVTEEDLANAWVDEFGVMYSSDRKRLLRAPRNICEYSVREGTKVICDGDMIEAQAGARLSKVSRVALENSLTGMEFASGIPGTAIPSDRNASRMVFWLNSPIAENRPFPVTSIPSARIWFSRIGRPKDLCFSFSRK